MLYEQVIRPEHFVFNIRQILSSGVLKKRETLIVEIVGNVRAYAFQNM